VKENAVNSTDSRTTPAVGGVSAAPRPPLALMVIALVGAALSFNAIRTMATPYMGQIGGIATAVLFDAAMWLATRWYIDTVKTGRPLRPALWLSAGLVGATLWVNIAPAFTGSHPSLTQAVVHGIGPGLFAAFTWIESTIQLRAYRNQPGRRERVPAGEKLIHPLRALRVWLMMTGTGATSYTTARAMCQNREARRRTWQAQHRPAWLRWLLRTLRPGWRSKVDPIDYVAYRWGAFDAHAHIIGGQSLGALPAQNPTVPRNATVPGRALGSVPPLAIENAPGNTTPSVPDAPAANTSGNSGPNTARSSPTTVAEPSPVTADEGDPAENGAVLLRGFGLPEGLATGRDLTAEQVAWLIRTGNAGNTDPPVRQVMRAFAVSYDKAAQALALSKNDLPPANSVALHTANGTST
jgi:hypothetical protein